MVFQKLKYNKLTKIWLYAIYKKYIKAGKLIRSFQFLRNFISMMLRTIEKANLDQFFMQIYKNLYCPVRLQKHVKSGKVLKIPMRLTKTREIFAYVRLVYSCINLSKIEAFELLLVQELNNLYNNTGVTIQKQFSFKKEVQDVIPNRRLLEKKKKKK